MAAINSLNYYTLGPVEPGILMDLSFGMGKEAGVIFDKIRRLYEHAAPAYSTRTLEARFNDLAATWTKDTQIMSSIAQMALHPAYQEIIGMGPEAVPFIIERLKLEPDHWFWALRSITGIDPVKAEARGNFAMMREAWLNWAQENGIIRS